MHPIHVIGAGIAPDDLAGQRLRMISGADVLVGGERLLARLRDFRGRTIVIKSPLEQVIRSIREEMSSGSLVVVVAEGDPGFFGIGRKLVSAFGRDKVILFPNVTTLQAAASRMKVPWESIRTVSLHGRADRRPLLRALTSGDLVGVFTDRDSDPAPLSAELTGRGVDGFRMWVFEDLGGEREKVHCLALEEARDRVFSPLNFLILERTQKPRIAPRLGLEDDQYLHEAGLITKKEVRAIGISCLQIEPEHTIWDLGAGCGSVSIESSLLAREGSVFAVEKSPARVEMIRRNIRRTGAYGVTVVPGTAPLCLGTLPDPDRIFVGGGLGRGMEMLEEPLTRLRPGGRVVLHLVLLGSLEAARTCLRSKGWEHEIIQVQVSRSRPLMGDERLESLNPVYVVSAVKPSG